MDVILNFNTGFVSKSTGSVVLIRKIIIKRYMRGWLLLDVISSLPFDNICRLLTNSFPNNNNVIQTVFTNEQTIEALLKTSRALRLLKLLKMLSLLRMIRVSRLFRYISRLEEMLNISSSKMKMFKVVLLIVILGHWNACVQYLVPLLTDNLKSGSIGMLGQSILNETVGEKYTWSMFAAMSQLTSAGYGRGLHPLNTAEIWLVVISMVIGGTIVACLTSALTSIFLFRGSSKLLYLEKIQQIHEFTIQFNLPQDLRKRILIYFEKKYDGRIFEEDKILNDMSTNLKDKILTYRFKTIIMKSRFFLLLNEVLRSYIIERLQHRIYLKNHIIFDWRNEKNMLAENQQILYVIFKGNVIAQDDQNVNLLLNEGECFGMLNKTKYEQAIVDLTNKLFKAYNDCEIYMANHFFL